MKKEKIKKKVKSNRKAAKKLLIIILIITLIISLFFYFKNLKVKNIYIEGNKYLTDQEIIELANLANYPNLFQKSSFSLAKKIKINPLVEQVKVKKNIFGKLTIQITEYNPLLKNEVNNMIYLSNNKTIASDFGIIGIPILTNPVPNEILKAFLTKLNTIDREILSKISEITYKPNEYDKDLFLFMMNDGNYVYITTTRLLNINKYESVLTKLENKKGILYLDSGNHFEILE